MLSFWFALPVAAILSGLGVHAIVLRALRARYRKKQSGISAEDRAQMVPGRSPLQKMDQAAIEVKAHWVGVIIQPLLLAAIVLLFVKFNSKVDLQFLVTSIVACGLVFIYCLWSLIQRTAARKKYRLDYDAEVDVGQNLDELASLGYHIFHSFSEDGINIDHVVVGPKGVFTVKTKGHPRSSKRGSTADATVTYNGHVLFFPKSTDEDTVTQAVQQADQLSAWLGKITGEPLSARAVIAIPGWFVKRTTSDGAPVVNPDQFASLFEHITARPLSEAQIIRLVEQIGPKGRPGVDG